MKDNELTMIDHFAGMLLANVDLYQIPRRGERNYPTNIEGLSYQLQLAHQAYEMADAMLRVRKYYITKETE
jgi:hypothetical protein